MSKKDLSAILPDGSEFMFWEEEPVILNELHVSAVSGSDEMGDGSVERPFATINQAAALAKAGTKVCIHAGVYRECVRPAEGGTDASHMIIYEAAGDGEVLIKASEEITEFSRSLDYYIGYDEDGTEPVIWQHEIDPAMVMGYNPFAVINCIHERNWLDYGATNMDPHMQRRGMIFVDGVQLRQVSLYCLMCNAPGTYFVEENGLKIHFRLPQNDDPANHTIEITTREQCFAPRKTGLAYIKLKGLAFTHAANGCPVPQIGAVSLRRGHHWIVEDCEIRWANTLGLDVGNEGWSIRMPEDKIVGYSVLRRNKFMNCGVCGVAGVCANHMLAEDNLFSDIGWQNMERAYESGGMKYHGCVDSLVRRNIFRNMNGAGGLWMDCNNRNNRFTQNLFLNMRSIHGMLYMEANRVGENMIDNNIFWGSRLYAPPKAATGDGIYTDNSFWNNDFDKGDIIGDGIHGDGTDDMWISHNLIGDIDAEGFSQNVVQFRNVSGRGGTSRNSTVLNNVFYNCRRSAIRLPNNDNKVDGNFYATVPNGFLRITYPAPSAWHEIGSWRRFEGFDEHGGMASFRIEVDEENLTMTFIGMKNRNWYAADVESYHELPCPPKDNRIHTDYFGREVDGDRQPGPFDVVSDNMTVSIDPRRL